MSQLHPHQKQELAELAVIAMRERGLQPEFGRAALDQLATLSGPSDERGADGTGPGHVPFGLVAGDHTTNVVGFEDGRGKHVGSLVPRRTSGRHRRFLDDLSRGENGYRSAMTAR